MLAQKEQAIEFIKAIPDEKFFYVMELFRGIEGLLNYGEKVEKQDSHELLDDIQSIRGIVRSDIDEKAELMEARDEKYANFD